MSAFASPAEGTLVSAEQFRQQLRFLKSNYELITPEAFRNRWSGSASLPRRAVLLTCDDGFLNVLTDMVPILLEEGARCLFFVTGASLLDAPMSLWYEELYRMLDAELRAMRCLRRAQRVRAKMLSKARESFDCGGIWFMSFPGYLGIDGKMPLILCAQNGYSRKTGSCTIQRMRPPSGVTAC